MKTNQEKHEIKKKIHKFKHHFLNQNSKISILYHSTYRTFLKRQDYRNGEQVGGGQGLRKGQEQEGSGCRYKKPTCRNLMRWTCSYFDYHFSILIAILSYSFPNYWRQLISLLYVLQLHMNLQALQIKTLCSKIRHKNVLSKCSKRFKCLVSLNGNIQCMDTGPHTTLGLTLTNASSSSLFYNVEFKINHTALFLLFFCKQTVLMCHSNFSSS